jgi:AcrR family transcriptional regulator
MRAKQHRTGKRRRPQQRRARLTVEAILDAAIKVAKQDGVSAVTTNRVAELAGVSIGSVYQYFPNKQAIFTGLYQRHVEQIEGMVGLKLLEHAASPLDVLLRAMVEGMVEAHAIDPELHELLMTQVPHRAKGTRDFAIRLHGAFRLAMAGRAHELKARRDLDLTVFIVAQMVDALSHGAVLRRPPGVTLAAAKEEAVRALLAYVHA